MVGVFYYSMEQQTATMTEVTSVTELTEGDRVKVTGNGLDVTTTVDDISLKSWGVNKFQATLAPVDGNTYTLTDTDHPLQSDGITANNGAVTVTSL